MVLYAPAVDAYEIDEFDPEWDAAPEPFEPEEGDLVTEDHETFYSDGKFAFAVADDEDMGDAIRAWMDEEGFYPNVWFLSDHGNARLMEY